MDHDVERKRKARIFRRVLMGLYPDGPVPYAELLRSFDDELARLDAEELPDTGPPLVGQRLAVDQDER